MSDAARIASRVAWQDGMSLSASRPSPPPPPPPIRSTLRQKSPSSPPQKGHHFRHPNKYHEGDRKRWKLEVTPREVKTYEGVWTTNRGKLLVGEAVVEDRLSQDEKAQLKYEISDLVVREIWKRSKLPNETLAEVWDLVDDRGEHRLTRDQFIVGMWLISRAIEGKRLLHIVPASVWMSVTPFVSSTGVKVHI
jgi:hypothetical protein